MRVLFVSRSIGRPGYYRCVLPAMYGGYDWAAIDGNPPGLYLVSCWVESSTTEPDFLDYDIVVLQQVRGLRWLELIKKMRRAGIVVLYEIDDYVHGIRKAADHDFAGFYNKDAIKSMELCMRTSSGMICSTQFLADKYRRVMRDRPVWVCENGLDMGRYRLSKPEKGQVGGRETVTIMWSGTTGHQIATLPWINAAMRVMQRHPHTSFVSIGQDFASIIEKSFPDRTQAVPFTGLECYPAAMTVGDVALAPAGDTDWYKAKSDLRAMEAAALGIPVVAHPHYQNSVVHGETGLVARDDIAAERALNTLISDDALRAEMAKKAKQHAIDNFAMEHRVSAWQDCLAEAVNLKE